VSEEYKLVPDTLYLIVSLIDHFLSHNFIEKQRLQLLGVACMLIASKYEEICASRVEEFCFITDNTYTREEVLKMESKVLNFLYFQLSVPTTKTFLRRQAQESKIVTIDVKLGWKKGTKITFPDKGNEQPNQLPADLVSVIDEKPYDLYKRDGNDLIVNKRVSLAEALGGTTINLTTLDGGGGDDTIF
ncbi:hypothetical protein Goshw_027196, partial [Gossypium schwendimanii]|nr:hypothetical protein [Gossypium schwendimanii]